MPNTARKPTAKASLIILLFVLVYVIELAGVAGINFITTGVCYIGVIFEFDVQAL